METVCTFIAFAIIAAVLASLVSVTAALTLASSARRIAWLWEVHAGALAGARVTYRLIWRHHLGSIR